MRFFGFQNRLIVAAVAGLVSMFLLWRYLRAQEEKIKSQFVMGKALVAKKYIAQGKLLTEDLLEEAPIPQAYIEPSALTSITELKNETKSFQFRSRQPILKGAQIRKSDLIEESQFNNFSWLVPDGFTAISIQLPAEDIVAGLVNPGDFVHVFWTKEKSPTENDTQLILKSVQVLAMGQDVLNANSIDKKAEPKKESDNYLVTLKVTLKEAALLSLSSRHGHLKLVLCSPFSTSTLNLTHQGLHP